MPVQLRFSQGTSVGTWAQAQRVDAGAEITIEGRATSPTAIASWRLLCRYAYGNSGIQPTPTAPVTLAQSADSASPSHAFTPANPGSYLIDLVGYPQANYAGTAVHDVRELRVAYEHLGDCEPAHVSPAAQTLISAQIAAGLGRHDNFGGGEWGWSFETILAALEANVVATLAAAETAESAAGVAVDALQAAGTAQDGVDALTPLVVPEALTWTSAALTLTRSGTLTYTGSDADVELTGVGAHTPGAVVAIKFPAGSITGEHVVTLGDSLGPLDAQNDGEEFDPALDYYVMIAALGAHQLMSTCRAQAVADTTAPQITAAVIASGAANVVALTTSESVTCAAATGFTVAGYTVSGISGSGTSWALALTGPVTPGATVSVAFDDTNVMQDASGNPLAAGSHAITNNAAYPTVSSAAITPDGSQLSVTYSRAVTDSSGAALDLTGTDATVTGVASGSGTATVIYDLSHTVVGGTITLAVASSSGITATDGLLVQAASGISVTSDAEYPTLESCTVDGATATLVWSEACTASSLDIGDFTFAAGTSAAFDSLTSGSGTDTWVFALDPAAEAEEEFTLSIAAGSGVVSTATGLALQEVSGATVTNSTEGAGWVTPAGMANAASVTPGEEVSPGVWSFSATYDWTDTDQLLDWAVNGGGSLSIVGGRLVISGSSSTIPAAFWDQGVSVTSVAANAHTAATSQHANIYSHLAGTTSLDATHNPAQGNGVIWRATDTMLLQDGTTPTTDDTRGLGADATVNLAYDVAAGSERAAVATYPNTPDSFASRSGTFSESTTGRLAIGGHTSGPPTSWGPVTINGVVALD